MRSRFAAAALACLTSLAFCAPAIAFAPPRVERSIPGDADADVDPALGSITVVFDQDMAQRGASFCGGGPQFPSITAKPVWKDARTCVLGVKLEPSRTYVLSINCSAAQNFRSAADEPAITTPLRFRTAALGTTPAVTPPAQNTEALASLRAAIDRHYSYRDRLGLDWDALFAAAAPGVNAADGRGAFVRAIMPLLASAKDPHIAVLIDDMRLGTFSTQITPNADMGTLAKLVPTWRKQSDIIYTGSYDDGIGYICILSWPGDASLLAPAQAALDEFADAPGIIIDVRLNGGGNELAARQIASRFLDAPAVYSRNRYRDPASPSGFGATIDRVIEPAPAERRYTGPVAVLQGPMCMSSNESFLFMMSRSPRVTRFGASSYGSSGNPKAHKLPNGVSVLLPSWQDLSPEGDPIEGVGIAPDVAIDTSVPETGRTDPILDAALKQLRKKP